MMEPLKRFAKQCTVVTYDHVGSGLSDRDGFDFSPEALLTEIEVVVDSLDTPQVAVFGWSTNAHTAVRYAVKHPNRVTCLVLLGWPRGADYVGNPRYKGYRVAMESDWETASEYIAFMHGEMHGDEAQLYAKAVRTRTSWETHLAFLNAMAESDVTDLLARVSVPTLVLQPRSHTFYPHKFGQALAAGISGAHLQIVEFGQTAFDPVPDFVLEHAPNSGRSIGSHSTEHSLPRETLTSREAQVVALVASGRSNHDIAQTLFLSRSTVERHVHNILTKLEVSNRVEAATWWTKHGGSAD
jgi:pimeloyl-ACP methyl ester carboxylesterase/DNA-binding CsgD family transcriptional regulator